jgi:hypothetical protein
MAKVRASTVDPEFACRWKRGTMWWGQPLPFVVEEKSDAGPVSVLYEGDWWTQTRCDNLRTWLSQIRPTVAALTGPPSRRKVWSECATLARATVAEANRAKLKGYPFKPPTELTPAQREYALRLEDEAAGIHHAMRARLPHGTRLHPVDLCAAVMRDDVLCLDLADGGWVMSPHRLCIVPEGARSTDGVQA